MQKLSGSMNHEYPKNVMAKVPMIVSSMYAHQDKEWIVWMDDDTWFNPGEIIDSFSVGFFINIQLFRMVGHAFGCIFRRRPSSQSSGAWEP